MKKITLLLLLCVTLASSAYAAFLFTQMPESPNFDNFHDYIQSRKDYGKIPNRINKDDFLNALKKATFEKVGPDEVYKNPKYPYDKSMPMYSGVFSLNDGTLFLWSIPRRGVIEITNSEYETGYLFYEKDLLDLHLNDNSSNKALQRDADKPRP
jgi:uncharacterized protein YxeA